jgi:hypothetical protein
MHTSMAPEGAKKLTRFPLGRGMAEIALAARI